MESYILSTKLKEGSIADWAEPIRTIDKKYEQEKCNYSNGQYIIIINHHANWNDGNQNEKQTDYQHFFNASERIFEGI